METDFFENKLFSKLMGEGSDIDESDDDDLDKLSGNQNINNSGIHDPPIKLDTSLMSESMIKLVRTIEERIDNEKLGPQTKVQNCMIYPSVQETGVPLVTHCSDFDGDPSVIEDNKYKLISDIEQGLNYLYDNVDTEIATEDNTNYKLAANLNFSDQIQLNENRNEFFHLNSLINNDEIPRLESKIVKHHLYDSSKLPELKTKSKSSGLGSEIKKRLGEKVEEVPTKSFQCRECKRKFFTKALLHQHLIAYGHKRKLQPNTQVEEKRLSRKSREVSLPLDRPAKLKKFSNEKRELSPEKKVICQHCREKFFSLENLLYHLRAEHKNRKNHIKDYAHRKKYTHSKDTRDSPSQEETEEDIELSESESNDGISCNTVACSICSKNFINLAELDCHLRLVHRDAFCNTVECGLCSKKFINLAELDCHLRLVHGDAFISDSHKFLCDFCRDTFLTKYDLIQHSEEKHYSEVSASLSRKRHVCKFCGVSFLKFQSLMYHVNLVHKL